MTTTIMPDAFGRLIEPATLQIQRLLPGPIERVWAYLTESELRRQWLASGEMEAKVGTSVELVWHNDALSDPPGIRPAGFPEEHRMTCSLVEVDPPHKLSITWGSTGGVTFDLTEEGREVLLTVTHRRVEERRVLLNVSAGWHAHLDVLVSRMAGKAPETFWDAWGRLRQSYEARIPE